MIPLALTAALLNYVVPLTIGARDIEFPKREVRRLISSPHSCQDLIDNHHSQKGT